MKTLPEVMKTTFSPDGHLLESKISDFVLEMQGDMENTRGIYHFCMCRAADALQEIIAYQGGSQTEIETLNNHVSISIAIFMIGVWVGVQMEKAEPSGEWEKLPDEWACPKCGKGYMKGELEFHQCS